MELKRLFSQPAFQVLLFILCLLLFNWPILSIIPLNKQEQLFCFVYSTWSAVILLLFLFSRYAGESDV